MNDEVKKPVLNSIDELAVALREGICKIKFKKVDGTVVERTFTLKDEIMAAGGWKPKVLAEGTVAKPPNPSLLNVFEVPTNQWKSFKKVSLISWSKI